MKKRIFLLLMWSCFSASVFGENSSSMLLSLEPLFIFDSFQSTANGDLAPLDMIKTALEFSECHLNSQKADNTLNKYIELENEAKNLKELIPEKRAEAVLDLIYKTVLKKYSEKQSQIDILFENGLYNCVSSTILYMALAKSVDLEVHAVETDGHAFCTVYMGNKIIDVETTNPYGFNPGEKKQIQTSVNAKQYAVVPAQKYAGRREVPDYQIVSLIGRNLSSSYMEKRDFQKAFSLTYARYLFVKDLDKTYEEKAREEIFTVISNYSNILEKQGNFTQSVNQIEAAYDKFGTNNFLTMRYGYAVSNAVGNYLNNKDLNSAENIFKNHKIRLSPEKQTEIEIMTFISTAEIFVKNNPADTGLEYIKSLRTESIANEIKVKKRLDSLEVFCWSEKILLLFKENKYILAVSVCEDALKSLGADSTIRNLKQKALYNHSVDVHNEFASLANEKKYEQAKNILEKGLAENPESTLLKNDLKRLQKVYN